MSYFKHVLENVISIDALYTIHYFEYTQNFLFEGESHDFWEFICVDKGTVTISMDEKELVLHKNEIAFHQPNEFHKVSTYGQIAPNLVVVSFQCNSPLMDFFRGRVLKFDERERSFLADILKEARNLFASPLDDPYLQEMVQKDDVPLGTVQLIKINLEHFLLHLMRRSISAQKQTSGFPALKSGADVFKRVVEYMETNMNDHLTIEQICRDNMIGRTQLQKIFQQEAGVSVIEFFSRMKIDAAKHMIRIGRLNFTQISEQLGYSSIHYFSRQFKKITGMTPSDYVSSIKAIVEKENH